MASADPPVLPPEEVALLELGATPLAKEPAAPQEHLKDPDATLPWDRCPHSARRQPEPNGLPQGARDDPKEAAPGHPLAKDEEEEGPGLPVLAAHVLVPIDPQCIERAPGKQKQPPPAPWPCEQQQEGKKGACGTPGARQQQLVLPVGPLRHRDPLPLEGLVAAAPAKGSRRCPCADASSLREVAAAATALLLCPCLVYGAFAFLPFDAPPLPTLGARLVYTLRCAAFATLPVVLGLPVSGIARLCAAAAPEPLEEPRRELQGHRSFVAQSVQLFVLYFFNLAVLATYLPQELLKLVPLLTGLFAISRLLSWLSVAVGRWFRAFGLGLAVGPLLAMLLWNLYGIFLLEPQSLLALPAPQPPEQPPDSGTRLRLWG